MPELTMKYYYYEEELYERVEGVEKWVASPRLGSKLEQTRATLPLPD